MTKQELKMYAEIKGYKIIEQSGEFIYDFIGLTKKNDVYYWFASFKGKDDCFFDHRYSCLNGKTSKGTSMKFKFIDNLTK